MSEGQNVFLGYLKKEDTILDLGCGSGRDSKIFIDKGYNVTAIDGSIELSREASKVLGKEVINFRFEDIDFITAVLKIKFDISINDVDEVRGEGFKTKIL